MSNRKRLTLAPIDAGDGAIESCETRLALSASLAADMLMDALDLDIQPASSSQPESVDSHAGEHDLLSQAADLRDTHGLDGSGQTVAVIDSGIAYDHVALGGGYGPGYRVVGGWDFAENDANPYDDGPAGFHGSHVSGLLAGDTNEFQGVAPGADLVALRVFDDRGAGELEWIESALQWVHDNQDSFESPITTINLSVGAALTPENQAQASEMLADELQALRDDNILVFAAAGNFFDGNQEILFPASDPNVTAISSTDADGALSDFAQRNDGIFTAPGESVRSSVPDHVFGWDGKVDDFAELDGTSMATPQAAGVSMLIRQSLIDQGIEPTADAILSRMYDSSASQFDAATGANYHPIDLTDAIGDTPVDNQPELMPLDRFDGTNGSERLTLDLTDGVQIRMGDQTFKLDHQSDQPLVIDVGGGADRLEIIGSEASERLVMSSLTINAASDDPSAIPSRLLTNDFEIELRGFEEVHFDGGGGRDRATLFDSAGDDTLSSGPNRATLEGVGFKFDVVNVPKIFVHGTAGGDDVAILHDSAEDDKLTVRPQFTSLRSDSTFQLAYGFESVYAYANSGGVNSAEIYDSAGDDTMVVSSNRSSINGPDYKVSAKGFSSVTGYAKEGGFDVAKIYADADSNWDVEEDRLQWTGDNQDVRIARGFERADAFENFQAVDLNALNSVLPNVDDEDDREQIAIQQADAARSVFEDLGR